MKKRILSLFLVAVLAILPSCSSKQVVSTNTESGTAVVDSLEVAETLEKVEGAKLDHNVTLLVTSDVHGGVAENYTLAAVYEKRKEYEAKGDYTLLIDDGDMLQGGLLSSVSKGEDLIDIMNLAGYDIATMGNHEFDYGMGQFLKNAAKLNNQYISCNFTKYGRNVFKSYVIKQFDGVRFAFIGVNTPDTLTTSTPKYFQDVDGKFIYGFCQGNNGQILYSKVQRAIDEAKAEGADYIIIVGHVGQKETSGPYKYTDIISNTSGIDVFLDGHSHDTDEVNMKDKSGKNVLRIGVGTKLDSVGVVKFTPEGTIEHELLTYKKPAEGEEPVKYDNPVSRYIEKKNEILGNLMSEVIGTTEYPLYIYDPTAKDDAGKPIRIIRRMETNLGNLVVDAYRVRTGADCAYTNGGGIRSNVEKGDIKVSDIKNVQPFGNIVCLLEVTGQQILDAMEWGCHVNPAESGGFPQVSGMSFELDTSIADPCKMNDNGMCVGIEGERRVKNLKINGVAVDPAKKYKLATLSYTALDHGDGYTAFDGCEVLEMGVSEDYLLVVDYIKENLGGKISEVYAEPYGEGRIKIS